MPIPAFDANGNIPIGNLFGAGRTNLVEVGLVDLRDRFVRDFPSSATRLAIWDGWMQHRVALEGLGLRYATLVNGSFVTSKVDPGDVDICVLLDSGEVQSLAERGQAERDELARLTNSRHCKITYHCDTYPLFVYPFGTPQFTRTVEYLSYWTRVFGVDRDGYSKALLLLSETGTI